MSAGDAIINPVKGKRSPKTGPVAVMAATRQDLEALRILLGKTEQDSLPLMLSRLYHHESGISLAGPFIGAPYAAMLLENLIAWGARWIIFIGLCGGISQKVKIGDVVVPSSAWIDEGTSRHYTREWGTPAVPSENVVACIGKSLHNAGLAHHEGSVWTTDAVFRETPEKVKRYQGEGALAVEMETSALFTIARFRGIQLAAVHVVSDELSKMIWKPGFRDDRFKKSCRAVREAVWDACRQQQVLL